MKITKEEVLEIVKKNGLSEEVAEQFLEMLGKGIGGSILDLIKLVADKSENPWDDLVVASAEPKLRKMVEELEIEL
jgi:hypothetical protein